MPKIASMNFEKALISASTTNSAIILSKIDWLTIIQTTQINQAIGYVQSLTTSEDTLTQFLAYFNSTWMVRFPQSLWNISAGMMNRTNNALERYNRRLNDFFPIHTQAYVLLSKLSKTNFCISKK
ncbi:hypothetical protein HZS_7318, partial [Henneguya salminicola]